MPKLKTLSLLAVLAVSLVWPEGAGAQQVPSPYRFIEAKQDLGITVSYVYADPGAANFGPQAGPAISVRYTRSISRPVSITPSLTYFTSEREVIDPSLEEGEGGGSGSQVVGTESIDLLLVAGRFNLNLTGTRTWHRLVPYLSGGLGIAFELTGATTCFEGSTNPDCQIEPRERFDFGTSFLLQLGFGTVWLPRQRIGVRLEFLNHIWRLATPPGYYDPGVTIVPIPSGKDWTNNLELGLTLSYWF
ncbi:MAG: hypothetical protein JSV86_11660 [Gemmatimonadota bacterium]|nr:MAG: hypothetical protein JSV86_11660 [Gemmatimonadota bacterium]